LSYSFKSNKCPSNAAKSSAPVPICDQNQWDGRGFEASQNEITAIEKEIGFSWDVSPAQAGTTYYVGWKVPPYSNKWQLVDEEMSMNRFTENEVKDVNVWGLIRDYDEIMFKVKGKNVCGQKGENSEPIIFKREGDKLVKAP
jgi:hypothetical protein